MDETADEVEEDFATGVEAATGESTKPEREEHRGRRRRRRRGRGRNREEAGTEEPRFDESSEEQASGEEAEGGTSRTDQFGDGLDIGPAEDETSEFDEQEDEAVDADVDEPGMISRTTKRTMMTAANRRGSASEIFPPGKTPSA